MKKIFPIVTREHGCEGNIFMIRIIQINCLYSNSEIYPTHIETEVKGWHSDLSGPGNKNKREDQCQHGLRDGSRMPVQRSLRIDSNMNLRNSCKRCQGHGMQRHGQMSAPQHPARAFCNDLVKDFVKFLAKPCCHNEAAREVPSSALSSINWR